MTHYFARSRRSRGAYLDALLAHHAAEAGVPLEELREYDEAAQAPGAPAVLVVADQPAPARGYALLVPLSDAEVAVRLYVLPRQPREVYKALFSTIIEQARRLRPGARLVVDEGALDPRTREAVEEHGAPYGLSVGGGAVLPMPEPSGPVSEEFAAQLSGGSVTVEAVQGEAVEEQAQEQPEEALEEAREEEPTEAVQESSEPSEQVEDELECEDCGRTFTQARYLTQHRKAKHED